MIFTAPYYLFGLLGVVLPIAIHLWNRKSGRIIKVGSIQFLEESESSSFSSVKLTELMLLFLRILLICLLCLLLAGASYYYSKEQKPKVLVDPALSQEQNYLELVDSLKSADGKWLQAGIPSMEHEPNITSVDYWSVIDHLGRDSINSFVVYSADILSRFNGRNREIPANVKWISLPIKSKDFIVLAHDHNKDSIMVLVAETDESLIEFRKVILPKTGSMELNGKAISHDAIRKELHFLQDTIAISNKLQINCEIIYDQGHKQDLDYVVAALEAINKYGWCEIHYSTNTSYRVGDVKFDWILMLKDSINTGETNTIGFGQEDQEGIYSVPFRPNPKFTEMQQISTLPMLFMEFFIRDKYKNRIKARDKRIMNRDFMKYSNDSSRRNGSYASLNNWIMSLLLIVLVVERTVSYLRKQ